MTSLYIHYALCFEHVEHSVCHEPISELWTLSFSIAISTVPIEVYMYIYYFSLIAFLDNAVFEIYLGSKILVTTGGFYLQSSYIT